MRRAALLVSVILFAAPPLIAQEWTAEQQEVIDWLDTFTAEAWAGDVDAFLPWLHPEFTSWDYSQKKPESFAAFTEGAAKYFETYSSIDLEAKPMSVTVLGDVAVVHAWYKEVLTSADGESAYLGRWTLVLTKTDDGWKNLAWTWTAEDVDTQKLKEAKEVKEAGEAKEEQ
jgi:ketosteroid isomerase-like protein